MNKVIKEEIVSIFKELNGLDSDHSKRGKSILTIVSITTVALAMLLVGVWLTTSSIRTLEPHEYGTLKVLVEEVAKKEQLPPEKVWDDLFMVLHLESPTELRAHHFDDAQTWLQKKMKG